MSSAVCGGGDDEGPPCSCRRTRNDSRWLCSDCGHSINVHSSGEELPLKNTTAGAVVAATKLCVAYENAVEEPFLAAMKVMLACDLAAAESPLRVAQILAKAIADRPSAPIALTETMAKVMHSYLLVYSASSEAGLAVDGEFRRKLLSRIEAILRVAKTNEEKQPNAHFQFYLHVSKTVLEAMEGTQEWSKTAETFGLDAIKAVASFSLKGLLSGLAVAVAKPIAALLKTGYLAYKRKGAKSGISALLDIAVLHAAGAAAIADGDAETAERAVRALRKQATMYVNAGEWLPVYAAVTAIGVVADASSAADILTSKGGEEFSIADAADFYRSLSWPRKGWRVRAAAYRAQLEMVHVAHISSNSVVVSLVATQVARAKNAESDVRARLTIGYREWIVLRAKIAAAGPVADPTEQLCEAVRGAVADVWDTSAMVRIGNDINSVKEELQRMSGNTSEQYRALKLRTTLARLEKESAATQKRLREEAAALGKRSVAAVDSAAEEMNRAAGRITLEAEKMQEACADVVARLAANQDLTLSERLQQLGTAVTLDFKKFRAEEAFVPLRGRDYEQASSASFKLADGCDKFLADDSAQVLLLLAGSGSGKSTFLRWRQADLWEKYLKQQPTDGSDGNIADSWVALRFELANSTTREDLVHLIEAENGLSRGGLEKLLQPGSRCRVLVLLDAFDEMPHKFSLVKALPRLTSCPPNQFKVIVTCRTEQIDVKSDVAYFTPMRSKKLLDRFQSMYVNPFDTTQISCFIELHVSHLKHANEHVKPGANDCDGDGGASLCRSVSFATRGQPREAQWYETAITSSPALLGMSSNPFVLKLIVDVLPTLLASSNLHLNEVYAAFAAQWFKWQANRLAQNELVMNVCASTDAFKAFSHRLATRMVLCGLKVVNSADEPWKSEFFTEPLVQCGAPLRRTGEGKFEFLHASLMQYFAATADDVLPLLSRRVLTYADKTEIEFLADRAKNDESFSNALMGYITASAGRTDIGLSSPEAFAASNAMTVLVAARRCLTGVSFTGVLLPSAILSGGHLHHCDFRGCNLNGAFINNTDVVDSEFSNAIRGEAHIGFNILHAHTPVLSLAVSQDGSRIVSSSLDNTVHVWDAKTGKHPQALEGHTNRVTAVAISQDGGSHIVSGSWDNTVRVWDAATGEHIQTLEGHKMAVTSVAISQDGSRILSGSWDKTVRVWDAETGKHLQALEGHTDWVASVAISQDMHIVSCSWDNTVRVWDAATGEHLQALEGHTDRVTSVAISQDGSCMRIVSGSWDNKTVGVWDAETGKHLQALEGHTEWVTSVAVSQDGSRIVSGSWDKTVRVWDAKTGKHLQVLEGHADSVTSVVISQDGSRIVSGSHDNTVRVWDATQNSNHRYDAEAAADSLLFVLSLCISGGLGTFFWRSVQDTDGTHSNCSL